MHMEELSLEANICRISNEGRLEHLLSEDVLQEDSETKKQDKKKTKKELSKKFLRKEKDRMLIIFMQVELIDRAKGGKVNRES
jgi:hypothetical protein